MARLEAEQVWGKYHDYEYPKLSIVIPTYNSAANLDLTLERIMIQDYLDLEIIIVDAGSTDRTLEIVRGYRDNRISICTVSGYHRAEMLNKGISQAEGQYINFLFPGDYYIYKETLKFMMALALDRQRPHLVFCGTLLRDGEHEPTAFFSHMSLRVLKTGEQPAALQSCWFRTDVFETIGKFDTAYHVRAPFELMCRFVLEGHLRAISCRRILVDHERRLVTRRAVKEHFFETFAILDKYFGIVPILQWFVIQRDWMLFLRLWWRGVHFSIMGKKT